VQRSNRAIGAILACAALVVSGCSGGEDPAPSKRVSASSSPSSASPTTAAASEVPAAARAHTPEGAEAFVRYFIDRVNFAWTTPEAGVISALSEAGCKSCVDLEKTASDLAKSQHRYDSPVVSVVTVTSLASKPGTQTVLFVGTQRKANVVDADGRVLSSDPEQRSRRVFVLAWQDQRWSVSQIGDANA
jgi:hypothetical protein